MPPLSVIIPWANRDEIITSLENNMPYFKKHSAEVIIVNYGGSKAFLESFLKNTPETYLRIININERRFNKSRALNIGAFYAKSNKLFFLDADIILEDNFLEKAIKSLGENSFVTIREVRESKAQFTKDKSHLHLSEIAYHTEFFVSENKQIILETNRVNFKNNTRSAPGLLIVNKKDFVKIDGMNSQLSSWGWEDLDVIVRLQAKCNLKRKQIGSVIHISHGDDVRCLDSKNRAESESQNFAICLSNYNQGNFLGSYKQDTHKLNL